MQWCDETINESIDNDDMAHIWNAKLLKFKTAMVLWNICVVQKMQ